MGLCCNRSGGIVLANRYWVGGGSSANWNATGNTNWGTASNTRDNASVPGSSDDVIFDGVGYGASNSTLSAVITVKSLTMTGYANALTLGANLTVSGNVTFGSGMTLTGNYQLILIGTCSLTTNGIKPYRLTINNSSSNVTLGSNLETTYNGSTSIYQTAGTFDANDYTVKTAAFNANSSVNATIYMGNSTWTLNRTSLSIWNTESATNLNIYSEGSTIYIPDQTVTSNRTFNSAGHVFNDIYCGWSKNTYYVDIWGSNTFNTLTVAPGSTFRCSPDSIQTVNSFVANGTVTNPILLRGMSALWYMVGTGGTNRVYNCTIQESHVSGTTWNAYTSDGNVDNGSNDGWNFSPPSSGNFFLLF
jgi:hypothetical protein